MRAALPACPRSEASIPGCSSSISSFLQQSRLQPCIIQPLPVIDLIPVHVEEVSHTDIEPSTDDFWRNIVTSLPHANRDTRNRVFRRREREEDQLHTEACASPTLDPT